MAESPQADAASDAPQHAEEGQRRQDRRQQRRDEIDRGVRRDADVYRGMQQGMETMAGYLVVVLRYLHRVSCL